MNCVQDFLDNADRARERGSYLFEQGNKSLDENRPITYLAWRIPAEISMSESRIFTGLAAIYKKLEGAGQ